SISPDVFAEHSNNFHTIETDSASDMFFDIFAEISRLVREEDYRYRDFVIIARDIKKYEKYLSSVSHKFSVPLFYDKRKPLKYAPLAKLAYNAYFASIKFNSDKIFNYLLSGFEIITEEEFDLLYNYVYMWSINGNDWLEKWYMNPDGFAEKTDDPDELQRIQKTIDKLNEIREKVIAPLQSLKNNTSEFARDKVKALYTFLDDIDASKMCAVFCEKKKQSDDFVSADFCRQSWDALIDVLNSLYKYIGNECVGDTEFCDLFYAAISSYAVGMIPQMLDEVSCGSADRIRPARPKCVFIIGLNLDEFPMTINENGILLNSERDMLIECGAKLVDNFTKLTVNENYLLYTCSCCASQKVYYCRSRFGGSNAALEPSPYFTKAEKMFPGCELNHDDLFGVATKESTFAVLSKNYKTKLGDTVQTALINDGVYAEKTERLGTQFEITDFTAHKEDVDKALGNTIYVSPTKVDTFYRCKFSYFCRYILKLESVRKAEIDNLSRGTLVHYILEKVIREYKRKIADLSREQLDAAAEKYAEEYLSNVIGSDFIMDGKIGFVIEEIKRMTKYVLYRISDEFYCSKFEPEYFEAKMSPEEDADFKSLVINADKKVVLRGNIDRADVWRDVNNKTYIRVVDYKTGKMKVNISDILYGLNLQMLLYLYGIVKNNTEDKSYIPAGVCYYLVDERTKTESDEQKDNEKVSTMYLFDDKLYNALDVTQSERFVKGMVTIKGKDGQKNNPFVAEDEMEVIFSHLDKKLKEMGNDIANGDFSVNPVEYSNKDSCKYCEFKSICMHEKELEKIDNYSLAQAMKKLTENADE
ncbi:MAG: PD-(D/E)XK nuclease family protein, partial [Oscillospiraceae bacterium]|nr:PD-(D/E)XK nuclease family protein [Candidatus Equicaccousia limihippi]